MNKSDIINYRLQNQRLAQSKFTTPQEVVSWMIAMQSQEFAMAKWAIGLRLHKATEATVDKAFNEGSILRTHLMRPTWHFVTPTDIRWLLALTAPRVHMVNGFTYRQFNLDKSVFKKSNDTIAKTLSGGRHLPRTDLQAALARVKIKADGIPLSALMMYAELEGITCSGPRVGKQFTYMLLDERAPQTKKFNRQEALAEFTKRYFETRGPATLKDFTTWSGLTMKDARDGSLELPQAFVREKVDGQEYIFKDTGISVGRSDQRTFLMPDYDEYGMSYKDRSALFPPSITPEMSKGGNSAYQHIIVINGILGGTWKRSEDRNKISVETTTYKSLSKAADLAVKKAVKKYCDFFECAPGKKSSR